VTNPVPPESQEPEPVEPESTEEEAPLNRAERRAKANKGEPTHVGPRGDQARKNRGSRPHTKRPR
jgi:hypothetical protein